MLKITEDSENGRTVRLRIDGTLTEICYPELESICARHQKSDGIVLLLDMAGVVFMQAEVARKLASLRGERLRIINCSPFIETLFETVTKN
jgi:anti-anti-sigma regulatory factor